MRLPISDCIGGIKDQPVCFFDAGAQTAICPRAAVKSAAAHKGEGYGAPGQSIAGGDLNGFP